MTSTVRQCNGDFAAKAILGEVYERSRDERLQQLKEHLDPFARVLADTEDKSLHFYLG